MKGYSKSRSNEAVQKYFNLKGLKYFPTLLKKEKLKIKYTALKLMANFVYFISATLQRECDVKKLEAAEF